MRRVLRLAGAVLLASSVAVLAWPMDAGAQSPDAKGWWYRAQQAGTPVPLPAPPIVPPGGLYVAQGPNSEHLAMAAVEYAVSGPGTATLVLTPAPGAAGTVAVSACPLAAGFEQVEAGAWVDAPAYNCTTASVDGVVAPDGTVTFALTAEFVAAGNTAMQAALIPTPGSAPFQVPFEPPGDGSFTAVAGPAEDAAPADTSTGASPDATTGSFDTGVATSPTFDAPADTGAGQVAAPSSPPEVAPRRPTARPRPVVPVAVSRQLADRVAAAVGLAIIGAGMWWLAGRPLPSPRLVGGGSSGDVAVPAAERARVGGIGRFARARQGPPNRL
jgi:hypothetical protein